MAARGPRFAAANTASAKARMGPSDGTERHGWQFATAPHASIACVRYARRSATTGNAPAYSLLAIGSVRRPPLRDTFAMVAGMSLMLVTGVAWAAQPQFVCVANGTCVYICASDRDCSKAGCILPHCDTHTPDGQLCLSDHAFIFCTQSTDCPQGTVCNGNLCETACGP